RTCSTENCLAGGKRLGRARSDEGPTILGGIEAAGGEHAVQSLVRLEVTFVGNFTGTVRAAVAQQVDPLPKLVPIFIARNPVLCEHHERTAEGGNSRRTKPGFSVEHPKIL